MINLHIVRNAVSNDSRVLKETATLASLGAFSRVEIAGLNEPGYSEHEELGGRHLWRVELTSRPWPRNLATQVLKFMEWKHRIVQRYRRQPLAVVHCHDLDPLPIAVRLKQLTGARIVYDAHELETEMAGLSETRKALARVAERRGMPFVDEMITVSPSIKAWYEAAFPGQRVSLVRNVPERLALDQSVVNLRAEHGVPEDALLFLYLGGLSKQRGVELLLAAFEDPRVPHHLLMMGSGPLQPAVLAAAQRCGRIHYRQPVKPAEVLRHAAGADVGISLIEGISLSYRYCLPNKLFESVLAGLPVLISDLPDQAAFVAEHDCGWPTACEVPAIVATLLRVDLAEHRRVKQGLAERTAGLGWAQEEQVLRALYARLGFASKAAAAAAGAGDA